MESKDAQQFVETLWQPPPEQSPDEVDPEGPWSAEAEMEQFRSATAGW